MRKNITIYNHRKFADAPGLNAGTGTAKGTSANPAKPKPKPNFKDPKYVNSLLLKSDAPQQLAFLAVRSEFGDDNLSKVGKNNPQYDKIVYTLDNVNKYITFLESLGTVKGINMVDLGKAQQKAIDYVTSKIDRNTQPPSNAGPGAGTGVTPSAQAPVLSPNQVAQQPQVTPEQADVYLAYIIPVLEKFASDETKPKLFTQRYSSEINEITNGLGILRNDSKYYKKLEDYNKRLNDLSIKFTKFMYPTGTTQAGNTTFVNDWYTLGNQIINEIQAGLDTQSKEKVNKEIGIFQTEFLNKNPANTDISGVANKVNQLIDKYNNSGFGNTLFIKLDRLR
jgi:hypothetical protein